MWMRQLTLDAPLGVSDRNLVSSPASQNKAGILVVDLVSTLGFGPDCTLGSEGILVVDA